MLFPQWQGAGDRPELYRGAVALASSRPDLDWQQLNVATERSKAENSINAYAEVKVQLEQATAFLAHYQPDTLFTLGGDCSVELAPISYLNTRYPDLGVIWFDAHADLQTPETSPSGDLHGMPLRLLLGGGDEKLKGLLASSLHPEQVILAGVRVLDPEEKAVTTRLNLKRLAADDINAAPGLVAETVERLGWRTVYLHVDLDVLDAETFSSLGWPEPGGLSVASLVEALRALHRELEVVGGALTEYLPSPTGHDDAAKAQAVLAALFPGAL